MKKRDLSAVLCLIVLHPVGIENTHACMSAGDAFCEYWWVCLFFFMDRKSTMLKYFFEISIERDKRAMIHIYI